jgi:serine O-acetyltransferase
VIFLDDLARFTDPERYYRDIPRRPVAMVRAMLTEYGAWAVAEYRFRKWGSSTVAAPVIKVIGFFTRRLIEMSTGISIPTAFEVGPGFYVGHFGGIIISGRAIAGEDFNISHGVTIGLRRGGVPRFGDRVYIAPGAKVIGGISIGDDAGIGANAVVLEDVPPGATAVGVPARILAGKRAGFGS